jgi:transcriptional regulator with XRE-family HTH domain
MDESQETAATNGAGTRSTAEGKGEGEGQTADAKAAEDEATDNETAEDETAEWQPPPRVERPFLDSLPGLVRRVRRRLGVSQRALAEMLGVSQSRVARCETGRVIPSAADLEDVLALGGATLVAVAEDGEPVMPMNGLAVRDRADRYYPAHCDPRGEGWWTPPGSLLTAGGGLALRHSREVGDPRITYDRGIWQAVIRAAYGIPPDHPTRAQVVAHLRAQEAPHRRAS